MEKCLLSTATASAGNLAILQHKKQPIPPTETFSCAGLARHKCFQEVFEGVVQSPVVPTRVSSLANLLVRYCLLFKVCVPGNYRRGRWFPERRLQIKEELYPFTPAYLDL